MEQLPSLPAGPCLPDRDATSFRRSSVMHLSAVYVLLCLGLSLSLLCYCRFRRSILRANICLDRVVAYVGQFKSFESYILISSIVRRRYFS